MISNEMLLWLLGLVALVSGSLALYYIEFVIFIILRRIGWLK